MADYDEPITDDEKVRIAMNFLTHAPPGEFSEVFNDVRLLLNNDQLLRERASPAFSKYNMDQFLPTNLDGVQQPALITAHGEQDGNRFFDPRSKKTFKYDHLRNTTSDVSDGGESEAEDWRAEVDDTFKKYIEDHYPHGAYAVYSKNSDDAVVITLCIEDHRYEPNNYWNGRWRSEWCATVDTNAGSVQLVHYYEDGNVQLVSQKECKDSFSASSPGQLAKEFRRVVSRAESDYQQAISENYHSMSETTFKALRRQLPVTRSKVDWNKILGYKIGKELAK